MAKGGKYAAFAIASVWFTTHFGGGFASGRQLVDFYVQYGIYALFMPLVSVGIITAVLYVSWDFSRRKGIFDYRSWSNEYFRPYQAVFSNIIEVSYLTILLMATAVAFATGGTVVEQTLGTPYLANTVFIAILIFLLTIFGADTVRKAASIMAALIIGGMLTIYVSNLLVNFDSLSEVIRQAPAPKGFGPALWQAIKYGGLQCSLIGAYIAVADGFKTKADVRRAALYGFIMNGGVLLLASSGVLAHYPGIMTEAAPILYITRHGGGGEIGVMIVSMIIFLAVISTGVGLIYGGTRRVTTWWCKRTGVQPTPKIDAVSSFVYVLGSWAIARFGLISLIGKGYTLIGTFSTPLVVVPILLFAAKHMSDAKKPGVIANPVPESE